MKGILTGYYLLQIGKGGSVVRQGEPTVFCAITPQMAQKNPNNISCTDAGAVILARAVGGIYSNETEESCSDKNGADSDTAGKGGEKSGNGNDGVIIIGDESK